MTKLISIHMLPRVTLSLVVANKKGTDQPAHPRSLMLIAYWKVSYLDVLQAKIKFSCKSDGLNLTLSETPQTGFLASRPNYKV